MIRSRLSVIDELLICQLRAVKRARNMQTLDMNNLLATCDHLSNLITEARIQVDTAKMELDNGS